MAEYAYLLREYYCADGDAAYVDVACPCKDPPGGPDRCFNAGDYNNPPPWFFNNPPPPNWQNQFPQQQPPQQQPPTYTQ
jgi:hypothetical protein